MVDEQKRCSIKGCDKPHVARGYCMTHYRRDRKRRRRQEEEMTARSPESEPGPIPDQEGPSPLPIPFPGFESFPDGDRDGRALAKTMVNTCVMLLNEYPQHHNRDRILETIDRNQRLAEMDDDQFHAHELYEANPLNKLTRDEKLHCIRTLPLPIVQKLFPHI